MSNKMMMIDLLPWSLIPILGTTLITLICRYVYNHVIVCSRYGKNYKLTKKKVMALLSNGAVYSYASIEMYVKSTTPIWPLDKLLNRVLDDLLGDETIQELGDGGYYAWKRKTS